MSEKKDLSDIEIRYTEYSDGKYLKGWLEDPSIARWFPMVDQTEIDDAVPEAQEKISSTQILDTFSEVLERQGYAVIRSDALDDERILVVQDPAKIPDHLKGYVAYSPGELSQLKHVTPDQLRQIHYTKKFFGGQIEC